MNGLREKFRNKKGFTLIEMLIVVAIIAILIAISIPMVGSSLENARKAVDQSNARSAISLATVKVLTEGINSDQKWGYSANGANGTLGAESTAMKGKSSTVKNEPLIVTYTYDANGGTFSVPEKYQKLLSESPAPAATAASTPTP